ncbi:DUF1580 domain-containing protein [Crateriforma conspicua]|uniref:Uncharacterized protein n=1 Tax=Crateriforma conspicua TaxID=2527996 RepID=A0A5C5Y4X0_9PLAN|nr:DUF1580 domain-containing protein [Crateriforma conspicua]TWT69345.1 hypothetical protein Pan14r_16310 [Crateriforma conspicua]
MSQTLHPDRMMRLGASAGIVERITGERPHPSTIYRWATRGLKGVKLRTAFAGGHRRTTEQWIREFFANITEAVDGEAVDPPTPSNRKREINRAAAELDEAGI